MRNISSGVVFLQFDSGVSDYDSIIVFTTNDYWFYLENSKILLIDGTFRSDL